MKRLRLRESGRPPATCRNVSVSRAATPAAAQHRQERLQRANFP